MGLIQRISSLVKPVELTWDAELQSDETLNDSDKKITVDTGEEWHLLWIWIELISSGTAGNRQMTVEIQDDADDVVASIKAEVTQAASLTRNYLFAPGMASQTAFVDSSFLTTPIPPSLILPAGYDVRIYDSGAIDAAADDMIVQMGINKRPVS